MFVVIVNMCYVHYTELSVGCFAHVGVFLMPDVCEVFDSTHS